MRLWEVYLIFPFMSPLNKPSLLQGKSHSLAKHMDKPGFSGTWEYQSGEQTLAEPAVPVSSVGLSWWLLSRFPGLPTCLTWTFQLAGLSHTGGLINSSSCYSGSIPKE